MQPDQTAVPSTPSTDLRELALAAVRQGDHALGNDGECGSPEDQAAVVDAVLAVILPAHRELLAQEVVAHADRFAPGHNTAQRTLRRHLLMAARVIAPKATIEQISEALRTGQYAGCRLDDAGRAIPTVPQEGNHG